MVEVAVLSEKRKIRVVLVEDQDMVLDALALLLGMEDDIEVVAKARNGNEALAAVRDHQPDILVTDIEMPGLTGLDLVSELKGSSGPKAIIVTTFAREGYLRRALEAGVRGYLLKTKPARELAAAVRRVHEGARVIDPLLAAEAWAHDPLTDRERQVLRLVWERTTTDDIASRLRLSVGTVRNHLSQCIDKLNAANRFDAARIAHDRGWL